MDLARRKMGDSVMSTLRDRIASVGTIPPHLTPYEKDYRAVTVQPTIRIQIYPDIVMYDELQPLIAPDGGIIPATSPGTWGQLYAVGNRRGSR